ANGAVSLARARPSSAVAASIWPPVTVRRLHRLIGIVMLLPFVGWAVTGAVFFIKPGYGGAYEALAVRTYPIESSMTLPAAPGWPGGGGLKPVLGIHLLERRAGGGKQTAPQPLEGRPPPGDAEIRALLPAAFPANPER